MAGAERGGANQERERCLPASLLFTSTRTLTHTHRHTRAYSHAYKHTRTRGHAVEYIHTRVQKCAHTHARVSTHTHTCCLTMAACHMSLQPLSPHPPGLLKGCGTNRLHTNGCDWLTPWRESTKARHVFYFEIFLPQLYHYF